MSFMQPTARGSSSTFSVQAPRRPAERSGGLDPAVRARTEARAGVSLGDVRVHYDSPAPRVLGAGAYAFGDEIHLGPGQEEHLPHEAWHLAQQRRGEVRPTGVSRDGRPLNDDSRLEREADARPRAISPVAAAAGFPAVLQLAFTVKQFSNGMWRLSGRPAFRSFVRRTLIKKWNADWDNAGNELDDDVSLSDEELDQCHVVPWAAIRDYILEAYLNGDTDQTEFEASTDALYGDETKTEEYKTMVSWRDNVTKAGPDNASTSDVQELGTLLNSATPNLRLDDKTVNRKIKDRPDPHLVQSPGGQHWQMTPNSFQNIGQNREYMRSPLWSPGGTHVYSSSTGPLTPERLNDEDYDMWLG